MPGSTTPRGVPFSQGVDKGYSIDDTMQDLAEWVDGDTRAGNTAGRGSASKIGEKYIDTETGDVAVSPTGSTWLHLASAARAELSAGVNMFVLDAMLPLGTPTATVASLFSRGTFGGVTNGKLTVAKAGLYRAFFEVVGDPAAPWWYFEVRAVRADGSDYSVDTRTNGAGVAVAGASVTVNLEAGGGIAVYGRTYSGNMRANHVVVERIGPA